MPLGAFSGASVIGAVGQTLNAAGTFRDDDSFAATWAGTAVLGRLFTNVEGWDLALQGGRSKLTFLLDVFNVFNDNDAIRFDDDVESRPGDNNPDFLKANLFQAPRNFRLGAKFTW